MTEFCFTNIINNIKNKNKSYDFKIISSYILSHTLYFSYLVFFSPYIFKLFSFLSPLFLTTFLLFLSLVTTFIPLRSIINSKDGFFSTTYTTLVHNFRPSFENGENLLEIEEFEVYKVVFHFPTIEQIDTNPIEFEKFEEIPDEKICELEEKTIVECESLNFEQKTGDTNPKKVEEVSVKNIQEETVKISGSKVNEGKKTTKFGSLKVKDEEKFFEAFPQTVGMQQNLGNFGSMRKEKEWRRTLACKLFEERHKWNNNNIINNNNINLNEDYDGEEGMDMLWETHEFKGENNNKGNKNKGNNKKENKIEKLISEKIGEENDEYYDNGKICCLQALKLSAGKMNLGMGTPNLVKISKAFKGIGWLHNQVRRQKKKKG